MPIFRWRSMFSRTTMELSTSIPMAKEIPARLTTLRLRWKCQRKMKDPTADTGMARAAVSVVRILRRKSSSPQMASMPPRRTLFFMIARELRM